MIAALSMLVVVSAVSIGYAVYMHIQRRREAARKAHLIHIARMYQDAHDLD
jgi:hypothetical protein